VNTDAVTLHVTPPLAAVPALAASSARGDALTGLISSPTLGLTVPTLGVGIATQHCSAPTCVLWFSVLFAEHSRCHHRPQSHAAALRDSALPNCVRRGCRWPKCISPTCRIVAATSHDAAAAAWVNRPCQGEVRTPAQRSGYVAARS
jgi:hypothetical protein